MFPDARFVMTHRDPTDVMLSVADVYADIAGGFTDHVDRRYLGELNVSHWSVGMDRAVKFRDGGADDRFFDIDFRAMQADPIGEVRRLYEWLGEPVTDEFEAGMRAWWADNAREPRAAHAGRPRGVRARPRRDPTAVRLVRRPLAERWIAHER